MQKKKDKNGLVRIIYGCVYMECLCCLLHVIFFKSFVVCPCFAKGISDECDDFYWLFFNGFRKW